MSSSHYALSSKITCAAVFCCAFFLAGCQSEGPNLLATVDDITSDPAKYYGQQVTVSGEVDDIYGTTSFSIGGEGFAEELLVIVPPEAAVEDARQGEALYLEDDLVQVSGTVREYIVADIEQEFGFELETEIEYEEQEPAVVAETIYLTPRMGPAVMGGETPDTTTSPGIMDTTGTPGGDTTDGGM